MILEKIRDNSKIWFGAYVVMHMLFLLWLYSMNLFQYETIDDFYQLTYFSGVFGEYSPFVMFSNVIYGAIMCLLFKFLPICNWMVVAYILISFISLASITKITIYKISNKSFAFLLNTIFLLCIYSYLYEQINFSKIAMIALAAGVVTFIDAIHDLDNPNKAELIIATILITWGGLLRFKVAAMVLAFVVVIFAEDILNRKIETKKIKYLLIIALSVMIPWGVNQVAYSSEGWSEANYRFKLLNGAVDYGTLPEEIWDSVDWDDIGFDSDDMVFALGWHFSDKNVFSVDALERMTKYEQKPEVSLHNLKEAIKNSVKYCMTHVLFWTAVLVLLLAFVINISKRWEIAFTTLLMLMETYYLVFNNRYPDRVGIIPWVVALSIGLYYFACGYNDNLYKRKKAMTIGFIAGAFVLSLSDRHLLSSEKIDVNLSDSTAFTTFLDTIDPSDNADLFLINYTTPILDAYSIFQCPEFGVLDNCVLDTGCMSIFPDVYEKTAEFGSNMSPYEAMVESDHVYLIDERYLFEKRNFIRKHYDEDIDISWVYSDGNSDAYSVTTNPDKWEEKDIADWGIEDVVITDNSLSYYMVSGKIDLLTPGDMCFLQLTDGTKTYTYEVRVQDNQFVVGIPVDTWVNSTEIEASLFVKVEDSYLKDNEINSIN